MKKQIFVLALVVLLTGVVSASGTLYNLTGIDIPLDVVAGNTFGASFSFDYLYDGENVEGAPLIIRLNISSDDEVYYPVMKGDFVINGRIEKSWFFNIFTETIYFSCSEEYNQVIEHPLDTQSVSAPDGTFYCYDEEGDLDLNEHDEIYLNITSHQALWPGEYNLSAELFYLTDGRAPFVEILNKDVFDLYYRWGNNISVTAIIKDGSELSNQWGMIDSGIGIPFINSIGDNYYFSLTLPNTLSEGNHSLEIFAKDISENIGSNSTILKIDLTAPEIKLLELANISDGNKTVPIMLNVVDLKAGVSDSSVEYRIREITNGSVCPSDGIGGGGYSCYTSDWLNMTLEGDGNFSAVFNATGKSLDGEFWFQARACDKIGNCGVLDPVEGD